MLIIYLLLSKFGFGEESNKILPVKNSRWHIHFHFYFCLKSQLYSRMTKSLHAFTHNTNNFHCSFPLKYSNYFNIRRSKPDYNITGHITHYFVAEEVKDEIMKYKFLILWKLMTKTYLLIIHVSSSIMLFSPMIIGPASAITFAFGWITVLVPKDLCLSNNFEMNEYNYLISIQGF